MPEHFSEFITVGNAAELGPGSTAAGENDGIGLQRLCTAAEPESGGNRGYFLHGKGTALLHTGTVKSKTEHIQNAVGGVGQGIDPSAGLRHGQKSQFGEILLRICGTESRQCRNSKGTVCSKVVCRYCVPVGQVASAVAGREKLSSDALLAFQQQHMTARDLHCGQRGDDSGSAAAYYGNGGESLRHQGVPTFQISSASVPSASASPAVSSEE